MTAEFEAQVRDHASQHLLHELGDGAEVLEVSEAGHHPRAHAVAQVRVAGRETRLFLKMLKPERKDAELFAYDRLLPTAGCLAPKVVARFPDWELPTIWLALEYIDGRWAKLDEDGDRSSVLSEMARLHSMGLQSPGLADDDEAPKLSSSELVEMYETIKEERDFLQVTDGHLDLLHNACRSLESSDRTWTRTDNHGSNYLMSDGQVWFIDWELLRWASPALDLENVFAHLVEAVYAAAADRYLKALQQHGVDATAKVVRSWIRDGLCHDALMWLPYAVDRRQLGESDDWFATWGLPRVHRLEKLVVG